MAALQRHIRTLSGLWAAWACWAGPLHTPPLLVVVGSAANMVSPGMSGVGVVRQAPFQLT
jgi:hypothetical protein